MRICFVSHSAGDGGAERVLLETIELLQAEGVECRVLLPSDGKFCRRLAELGVPFSIISYPMWMARGRVSVLAQAKAVLNFMKDTLLVAWKIFRWKSDVVYSNTSTVCVGAFAARLLGRPHVWHLHEFGLEDQGLSFLFSERFSLSLIDRLSSRCVCVSSVLARKYEKSIEPSKIVVIYPSMHLALDEAISDEPVCLAVARTGRFRCVLVGALIEGKGQEEAIRAFARLKEHGVAAELLIVGAGESRYRRDLEELAKGLEQEVFFIGHVKNALAVMRNSDAVLVCSRSEAFGRVTIEGMFSKRPVIGARSGATAELIQDRVTGLFYALGDSIDLANKITSVYEDRRMGERLGRTAQEWVKSHFSRDRYVKDLFRLLVSVSESTTAGDVAQA